MNCEDHTRPEGHLCKARSPSRQFGLCLTPVVGFGIRIGNGVQAAVNGYGAQDASSDSYQFKTKYTRTAT